MGREEGGLLGILLIYTFAALAEEVLCHADNIGVKAPLWSLSCPKETNNGRRKRPRTHPLKGKHTARGAIEVGSD